MKFSIKLCFLRLGAAVFGHISPRQKYYSDRRALLQWLPAVATVNGGSGFAPRRRLAGAM
ncbi:MAG: hypothetical protein ABI575_05695 [Oxalobacteraceae bacterium]